MPLGVDAPNCSCSRCAIFCSIAPLEVSLSRRMAARVEAILRSITTQQ